jgi:hypothetical protein
LIKITIVKQAMFKKYRSLKKQDKGRVMGLFSNVVTPKAAATSCDQNSCSQSIPVRQHDIITTGRITAETAILSLKSVSALITNATTTSSASRYNNLHNFDDRIKWQ